MGFFDKLFGSNNYHNSSQTAALQREIESVRKELEQIRVDLSDRMTVVEQRIKERDQ